MIRASCPNCSAVHRLDNLMAGRRFVCPDCGKEFRLGKPATKNKEAENAITSTATAGPEDWQPPLDDIPKLPKIELPREAVRERIARQETPPEASPSRGSASSRPAWSWLAATLAVFALCAWCFMFILMKRRAPATDAYFGFAVFLTLLAVTFQFARSWQAKLFGIASAVAVALVAAHGEFFSR